MSDANTNALSKTLSKIPLFYGLQTNELGTVLAICKSESFTEGDTIFTEGDPSHSMYILLAGHVGIKSEKKGVIVTLNSCDIFGEIGLITQRTRSASAMAASSCNLLRIDHIEFNLLAGKHPRVSSILMKNISTNLANHVVRMNNDASSLEHIPSNNKTETKDQGTQILNKTHIGI
jgi:CRP-like cAMP-binding protein